MSHALIALFSLLIGYACGNFLTANFVARAVTGKPVWELGDGNPGMANVGHKLGTKAALAVLAGDILKTVIGWAIARALFPEATALAGLAAGLGVTLGHNYPLWHRLKGGKGVTTTCSAIILAAPLWGILSSLLGFLGVIVSGYLCIGAIVITWAYFAFITISYGLGLEALVALVLALLMQKAHWSAIVGIKAGTTRRASIAVKVRKKLHLPPLK